MTTTKTKQEEIREGMAKQLYMDWNRYDEDGTPELQTEKLLIHWNNLPEESKQVYREWVDVHIFQPMDSVGVVLKVERELPSECGLCTYLKNDRGLDLTLHNWVCLSPDGKCAAVEPVVGGE